MRKVLSAVSVLAALALAGCNVSTDQVSAPGANGGGRGGSVKGSEAAAPAGAGAITPENTRIEFVGTKKGGKEEGSFTKFSGTVSPTQGDFAASKISIDIDTDSLTTANPKLTNHLKSPDFFEVKKYPKASFVSTKIEPGKSGEGAYDVTGDFTLHGTTKSITVPVKVTKTPDTLTLDCTFTIDRTEYGIAFSPDKVDPTVTITVSSKVARK